MSQEAQSFRDWERVLLPSSLKRTMLLSFDLEECEKFSEKKPAGTSVPDPQNPKKQLDMFSLSHQGAETIRAILNELGLPATFFVTVSFAKRYPDFVKELVKDGHEIGVHALEHQDNYRQLWEENPEKCRERILKAKEELEELTGQEMAGFRPPQLQSPELSLLKELGFVYDSSLHPTYVPGRYNHFFEPRGLMKKGGFYEVPVSVSPVLRAPLSWFWFRNLGLYYVKRGSAGAMKSTGFCNLYFHPWDFYPLDSFEFMPKYYARNTRKMPQMFKEYLQWCKAKGWEFSTMKGWLEKVLEG
jgi:peptidoglycan/xylan/chitin deacetylase (PgdA/CDA1 family)